MNIIRIPKFSENMEEATIVEWVKKEGDAVDKGDHLLTVITDKADVEIEAEEGGTLLKIVAEEKSSVPVNFIVGIVGSPDDELPDYETTNREAQEQFSLSTEGLDKTAVPPRERPAKPAGGSKRVQATPKAKRLAKKVDVELATVRDWANAEGPVTEEMIQDYLKENA